jgi:hypothetical protein
VAKLHWQLAVIINGTKWSKQGPRQRRFARSAWPGPPKRFVPTCQQRSWPVGLTQSQSKPTTTKTMGRLLGRLFVAFTTGLICFISYTPQIFIMWPWYGREFSMELLTLLVPFKYDLCNPTCTVLQHSHETFKSILVGILLYNYYLCVTTDPGGVPDGWVSHGPSSMTSSTYVCAFRGQNSMTLKDMRSRS